MLLSGDGYWTNFSHTFNLQIFHHYQNTDYLLITCWSPIPTKRKCFLARLAVVFAQSNEARC